MGFGGGEGFRGLGFRVLWAKKTLLRRPKRSPAKVCNPFTSVCLSDRFLLGGLIRAKGS